MAIGDGVSAIAALTLTFGGFSPTAMDGVEATRAQIERVEAMQAEKRAAAKRRREIEFARTSKPKRFTDDQATTWTYVTIDERYARIEKCETAATRIQIPSELDGLPVVALQMEACGSLDTLEEVVCPDSIESIGACAFRWCENLRRIVFPASLSEYSSSWLRHCNNVEEIVLPGKLDSIKLDVFESDNLRTLVIGPCVHDIEPGAFQNSRLSSVRIHPENPFIMTDGVGIYTIDGRVLLALACPSPHFAVRNGCRAIGKKACYGAHVLESASLPDGVEALGEFAFAHSDLHEFVAPASLKAIGEKALFYCTKLRRVVLNDGLEQIGASAFENSALRSLHIPATIQTIGASITERTNIVHSGPGCSIEIDEQSKSLFLDGEGGLYRRMQDGIHLVQLIDREIDSYRAFAETLAVDRYAFAHHARIREVALPDGVASIGDSAFRNCAALERVELPDTVQSIGAEAFIDTELVSFRVPAALESLGANALVTRGAHHGDELPSLRMLEVAPGNDRFYLESGILCRRNADGDDAVIFNNTVSHVVIPRRVTHIDAYAFNNARGIEYLELGKQIKIIGTSGLATWCWIEHIHVELPEPVQGRTTFDFRFPNIAKSKHGISIGIGGSSWVNVAGIMAQYDMCVINSHDYHSPRNTDSISIYDQVTRVIDRLRDPILLTQVNRDMYERLLRNYIVDICVDVARHDDREVIDYLVELGFVNGDNLEEIIVAVGKLQDAAMTGYLLEVKRRRFGRVAFDFDL